MNRNIKETKLSDRDKKILKLNTNICTGIHGKNCDILDLRKVKSDLNIN
jgi:hypothetical protein